MKLHTGHGTCHVGGDDNDPNNRTCQCVFGWTGAYCQECNNAQLCNDHGMWGTFIHAV